MVLLYPLQESLCILPRQNRGRFNRCCHNSKFLQLNILIPLPGPCHRNVRCKCMKDGTPCQEISCCFSKDNTQVFLFFRFFSFSFRSSMSKNFVPGLPEALVPTGPVRGRWIISRHTETKTVRKQPKQSRTERKKISILCVNQSN